MKLKLIIPILLSLFLASCHTSSHNSTTRAAEAITVPVPEKPYENVNVAEFEKLIGGKNTVLLDVRTPEETAAGKIEGAIEVNVLADDFAEKINTLDKDKTYLVYCRSGRRSLRAIDTMLAGGFTKMYNLEGGYNAWSAAHQ